MKTECCSTYTPTQRTFLASPTNRKTKTGRTTGHTLFVSLAFLPAEERALRCGLVKRFLFLISNQATDGYDFVQMLAVTHNDNPNSGPAKAVDTAEAYALFAIASCVFQ